ncbi:MAG: mechanosensitive ion channel protein MscS [Alphaproteobacteria bacterium]|nr:mechanosensitive ion channel protein MscS [Alphaproteobacteria bacterium]|tara:strand:+ start:1586 stop:3031 length:1446 start_codon:yes stop_codon:yes gene_type:complete
MIKKITLSLALLLICIPNFVYAQSDVNSHDIDELIKTIESETAREEFLSNLRALQETAAEKNTSENQIEPVLESLGFDGAVDGFINKYKAFISDNNLNASSIGKSVLSGIGFILFGILLYITRSFSRRIKVKLKNLAARFSLQHSRFLTYNRIIRFVCYALFSALFIYSIFVIWSLSDFGFLKSDLALSFIRGVLSITVIVTVAVLVWEVINGLIEYNLRKASKNSRTRLKTLLPIIRNISFLVYFTLFTLVFLSELGINIMPLLAGAGIFGVAIGFGAQNMVKDFLTGFTIILEDLLQVGDVVRVAGRTGFVEKVTLRKIQLRDLDGAVYTVPFSEIDVVENLTKDYSFYLMDIGISYREDTDEVVKHLETIDEEMRNDKHYKNLILSPIEILGVDKFADSAVIIKARLKTRPIKQWEVGREFNRRMKIRFDEYNIEIPFPHQTIYFGVDKEGKAPAAPLKLENAEDILLGKSQNSENTK